MEGCSGTIYARYLILCFIISLFFHVQPDTLVRNSTVVWIRQGQGRDCDLWTSFGQGVYGLSEPSILHQHIQ